MSFDLCAAESALRQMLFYEVPFVFIDSVQGVHAEEFFDRIVGLSLRHAWLTPAAVNSVRSRFIPDRIRLFTVPSGSPNNAATSRYV